MATLLIIISILIISLTGCENKEIVNNNTNYNAQKQLATIENSNNILTKSAQTELASFSTTIYTKTEERQNNVKLCTEELNEKVVGPNETFSFCDTLRSSKTRKWL